MATPMMNSEGFIGSESAAWHPAAGPSYAPTAPNTSGMVLATLVRLTCRQLGCIAIPLPVPVAQARCHFFTRDGKCQRQSRMQISRSHRHAAHLADLCGT